MFAAKSAPLYILLLPPPEMEQYIKLLLGLDELNPIPSQVPFPEVTPRNVIETPQGTRSV